MRISHSMLWTWRRCRQRFKWAYVDRLEPLTMGRGLMIGRVGHEALAHWYTNLGDVDGAIQAAFDALCEEQDKYPQQNLQELVKWPNLEVVLARYCHFSLAEDQDIRVVAVERPFYVGLLPPDHILRGRIDAIVQRSDNTNWLMEHKFQEQASVKHLALDIQVSYYLLGARAEPLQVWLQEQQAWPISGVWYNIVRTRVGGIAENEPVLRDYAYRPDNEELTQLLLEETRGQAEEMIAFLKMTPERRRKQTYKNPAKDCHWTCPFFNACLAWQHDGDATPVLQSQFRTKEWKRIQ